MFRQFESPKFHLNRILTRPSFLNGFVPLKRYNNTREQNHQEMMVRLLQTKKGNNIWGIPLKYLQELGMEVDWIGYSRTNFMRPERQFFPHEDFRQESDFLKAKLFLAELRDYTSG